MSNIETINKFLIIQLYSNGDCLYATTLAKQLKTDYPNAKVTWAVSPNCAAILINNPFIDQIWKIDYIPNNLKSTFDANKDRLFEEARQMKFDKIIFSQIIADNFQWYNGNIRSTILSAYPGKITVSKQPVLQLLPEEIEKVRAFLISNSIKQKDFVILYEFAPLSGQVKITKEEAIELAEKIVSLKDKKVKVILSSAQKINSKNADTIDGSVLSLRETAYLINFCNLLLGSSSGISWASTSTAGQSIPSVQIIDKEAYYFNSPIADAVKNNLPHDNWIEIYEYDQEKIIEIVKAILLYGFEMTKLKYYSKPQSSFKIYRGIIHGFLCKFKFRQIYTFIKINLNEHGCNLSMIKSILLGFLLFPSQLIYDSLKRKV